MSSIVRSVRGEAPLRLAIYRPHANIWFRNPVRNILRDQRLPNKYGPLLDHLLASGVAIRFTTALVAPSGGAKAWIKFLGEPVELLLWCLLNRIPLRRVGFVFRRAGLRGSDALLLMHYGNLTHEDERHAEGGARLAAHLAETALAKVVHLTHFAYCPTTGASNLARLRPQLLVAENDLARHSAFFGKYFGGVDAAFKTLPYVAASRFVRTAPFEARISKAVATGSITYRMRGREFIGFYGGDELQPLRRAIYENAAAIGDQVDSFISDLDASRSAPPAARRSLIRRVGDWLRRRHPQAPYYKKDIVSIYNSYTMFVVPEEICDLPAIGFVEGMSCGCAYLGVEGPMYAELGLVAGVHYVAYDGTLAGLVATARHFQQAAQREALEAIAEAGRRFVTDVLAPHRVYDAFIANVRAFSTAPVHG